MKNILKDARERKGLKTREVAQLLHIDQALISKFENGLRHPTRPQVKQLSELLEIDYEMLMIAWLTEKILNQIGGDQFALEAIRAAEAQLTKGDIPNTKQASEIDSILNEFDILKKKLDNFRHPEER